MGHRWPFRAALASAAMAVLAATAVPGARSTETENNDEPAPTISVGASAPVTPAIPNAAWVDSSQRISDLSGGLTTTLDDSDNFGNAVDSLGDVDGDGIDDLAVGAFFDDDGGASTGAVYILFLNANGTVKAEQKISDTVGGLTTALDNVDLFGIDVTGLGDLDGDTIPDVAVGAYLDDDGGTSRGAVHILFLNANGTVKAEQKISDTAGNLTAALTDSDFFGRAVSGIGDLDGDSIPDLAVGATGDDDGGSAKGAVYILFLNANGTVKAEQKISDTAGGLTAPLGSSNSFAGSLTGLGDLNGDTIPDLAVGAYLDDDGGTDRGAIHILFLDTDGTVQSEQKISDTAGGLSTGIGNGALFGYSVTAPGDLDRNGTVDIAVGVPFDDVDGTDRGAVHLLFLRTDGTVESEQRLSDGTGGVPTTLDNGDQFGYSVTGVDDLDGDGTIGLVVGASGDDDGGTDRGAVHVIEFEPVGPLVVNSTGNGADSGAGDRACDTGGTVGTDPECTLRAAIVQANAQAGTDRIHFDIPTSDPNRVASPLHFRIRPPSLLPAVSAPVIIDGSTQPEFVTEGRPVVELDGVNVTVGEENGLWITGGGSTVRGLLVNNWRDDAIDLEFEGHNTIVGNWIGIGPDGTSTRPNEWGVNMKTPFNVIGGLDPADANVISGNGQPAIRVTTDAGDDNSFLGNLIGVDPTGTIEVANDRDGIEILGGPDRTVIIGNLITHSGGDGIDIVGSSVGTIIQGNTFGTDLAGTASWPGRFPAVNIEGGATNSLIGGVGPGEGNVIRNAGTDSGNPNSISIWDTAGSGHAVLGNSITGSGGIGIDLDPIGTTVNDAGDGDSGPNDLLNTPEISTVASDGTDALAVFDLDVPANTDDYRVEFFTNPGGANPGGNIEAELFAGSVVVSPGTGLQATIAAAPGDQVTATATRIDSGASSGFSSTSEISGAETAVDAVAVVNSTRDLDDLVVDGSCDTGGTVGSDPECTMRAALTEASSSSVTVGIDFAIPIADAGHSAGVWTITPASPLPDIDRALVVDGTSQPGFGTITHPDFGDLPVIEIDGSSAGAGIDGLVVNADDVEVRGLVINRFGEDGIDVTAAAQRTVIAGNLIGTDPSGLVDQGNTGSAIHFHSGTGSATVGGTAPADRNLLSGNTRNGVDGSATSGNVIIGNWIGVDATGNDPLGNDLDGVQFGGASVGNAIGQPGHGNVISANGNDGIELDSLVTFTTVHGNTIGLGLDGSTELGNGRHGIVLYDGANNTSIGGIGVGDGNVISANTEQGVHVNGNSNAATADNVLRGNMIGTDATGLLDRGNGEEGVLIRNGAVDTIIGGSATGAGNIISGNGEPGVHLVDTGVSQTIIAGNTIGLGSDGSTPLGNDAQGLLINGADTVVGGSAVGAGNVISTNGADGVLLYGGATGTEITGNLIGTDATGLLPRGNTEEGIEAADANDLVIGTAAAPNVVADNGSAGIHFYSLVNNATVQGNLIGTGSDGTTAMGNGGHGIELRNGTIGALIGGPVVGDGNLVTNSLYSGTAMFDAGTVGNAVIGNAIVGNGTQAIDLGDDGPDAIDPGDGDSGPNDRLNRPTLDAADDNGSTLRLRGTADVPAGTYRVEVFANPSGLNGNGVAEAESLVAVSTLVHGGSGPEPFTLDVTGAAGDLITVSITEDLGGGSYGSTSELSDGIVAAASGPVVLDDSGRRSDVVGASGGDDLAFAGGPERLVGPPTDVTSSELTVSARVRLDSWTLDPRLISKATSGGTPIYELAIDSGTSEAVGRLRVGGGSVELRGGAVSIGEWTHVTLTWDGATARLFVDGSQVDSAGMAGALDVDVAGPLVIGNRATADRGLVGSLDDVRLADVGRSIDWVGADARNDGSLIVVGAPQSGAAASWAASAAGGRSGSGALAAPITAEGQDAWATVSALDEPGVEFASWWRVSDPSVVDVASGTRTGAVPIDQYETALTGSGFDLATIVGPTRSVSASVPVTLTGGTWSRVVVRTDELGGTSTEIDGIPILGPITLSGGADSGSVGLRAGLLPGGESWFVDDVRIRRYVSDEPVAVLGPLDRP